MVEGNICHIAVFKKNKILCLRYQCSDIRCDQVLSVCDTDHQRTATTCGNQPARLILADDAKSKSALKVFHRRGHGGQQILSLVEVQMNLVHDDFSIGLRGKTVTVLLLPGTQFLVVLNDAIVHHCHAFMADMRVSIFLAGFAVRRPARVGNAGGAADRRVGKGVTQFGNLANLADSLQAVILTLHRHTRRVIATVFQPSQAIDQ